MKSIKKVIAAGMLSAIAVLAISCKEDTVPKPQAYLRLEYPMGKYIPYDGDCPYTFGYNSLARIKDKGNCNLTIEYPKMKATLYLTYKTVEGNNLEALLRDAQKLTYEHVIKADAIQEQPYLNPEKKVYGMFYQVGGDAATNAQFYVTDSTRHFLTGSMYFYAKPNFDSIMPAASYIKDDMRNIMETLKWK
ncbi:gliding motility lipoprotein GldD [Flavobacterium album]|uniref:Gliding motility lipoprotein GldD n=1 Tax=Flavobacterium album TaxID=2175091 RepID=A0A2S1QWF8_9FLAO|nr:gliding motility lipoprotein GldD [Flavobacterium album]AWH84742.1 gliding motility lipoprotein GldD [Flavobacterium album]